LDEILGEIERLLGADGRLNLLINAYERGFEEANSLLAFCRCKSSDDTKDERAGAAEAKIREQFLRLERTKEIIFEKIDALDPSDAARQTQEFARIKFLYDERKNSWRAKFDAKERKIYEDAAASSFTPLYGVFRHLNNLIAVQATDKNGVKSLYNLSKCAGVLKGSPDAALRKSVFDGLDFVNHFNTNMMLQVSSLAIAAFVTNIFCLVGYISLFKRIRENTLWKNSVLYTLIGEINKENAAMSQRNSASKMLVFKFILCASLNMIIPIFTLGSMDSSIGILIALIIDVLFIKSIIKEREE